MIDITKIERFDAEIHRLREKEADIQAKIRTLEEQKTDEENVLIIQMVRKQKMTPDELARFLERNRKNLTNPTTKPNILLKNESENNKND